MKLKNLKDYIIDLQSGKRPKGGAITSGIPSLGGEHINAYGKFNLDEKKLKYVPVEYFNELSKGIIQKNDILLVKDGATTGKVAYVDKNFTLQDACINEHLFLIRTKDELNSKYLFYYLFSDMGQKKVLNDFRGATVGGISKGFIDMDIYIPSLVIQNKIVDILDKAQQLIDKRKEQIEALDELVKSKFIEMFGDPALNPMEWNVVELSSLLVGKASNGFFAKNDEYKVNGNSKVMWLGDIINRRYSNTEGLKVVDVTEIQLKKYKVGYGDLLFCRSSLNKEGIGKASAVPKDVEDNIMFECHIIRTPLDLTKCIPEFIQVQSEMGYFRNQIMTQSKTSTMTTIGQEGILKTKVILPNIELQKKFVKFIYQTDKLKSEMENSLKELEDNFNSLMQRAFKGELFN